MKKTYMKINGVYQSIPKRRQFKAYVSRAVRIISGSAVLIGFAALFAFAIYGYFALGFVGE